MKTKTYIRLFLLLLLAFNQQAFAQTAVDACGSVGAGATLTIGTSCSNISYNIPAGFGNEIADPSCGISYRDGWYRFTTSATQNFVTIVASTNRNVGIAVYSGTCGSLVEQGCRNAGGADVTETLNMVVTPSTTYYVRIFRANNAGSNAMTGNLCIFSPPVTTTCSATFTDNGGAGTYLPNSNYTVTYCPSTAGQCIRATFSSFDLESGYDYLTVYNGSNALAPELGGSPFSGTTSPGVLTGTTTNPTGCLTFNFTSDGSGEYNGWSVAISCATCAVPPPPVPQDCNGGTSVCSDAAFSGNSSGAGNVSDLTNANDGCLSGESESSWYYFSPSASGTISLNITPDNPTDDYDFAIWGPMATITCPPVGSPVRCSYAGVSGAGITGLNASASPQNSEGAGGDGFVNALTVTAGQKYIMVINNYSASSTPFTLDWTTGGGATLNCAVLPIQLAVFDAVPDGNKIKIDWTTLSELRNDFFTVEKSTDGINFFPLEKVNGAGTVSDTRKYETYDPHPSSGTSYYRLKQTDFDGQSMTFDVVPVTLGGFYQDIPLEVYPVPASGWVQVRFKEMLSGNTNLMVTDVTGRVLSVTAVNNDQGKVQSIDVSALSKGVYFVSAENKVLNKKSMLRKIVVE